MHNKIFRALYPLSIFSAMMRGGRSNDPGMCWRMLATSRPCSCQVLGSLRTTHGQLRAGSVLSQDTVPRRRETARSGTLSAARCMTSPAKQPGTPRMLGAENPVNIVGLHIPVTGRFLSCCAFVVDSITNRRLLWWLSFAIVESNERTRPTMSTSG